MVSYPNYYQNAYPGFAQPSASGSARAPSPGGNSPSGSLYTPISQPGPTGGIQAQPSIDSFTSTQGALAQPSGNSVASPQNPVGVQGPLSDEFQPSSRPKTDASQADVTLKKFSDLTPENMQQRGVKGMVFDVDDTLSKVKRGQRGIPQDLKNRLKALQDSGVQLGIVSNNSNPEAVLKIQQELANSGIQVDVVGKARKPDPQGLQIMQQRFGLPANQIMMVGDNPGTDMKSGNRAGFQTAHADWFGNSELHKAWVQKTDSAWQFVKGEPDDADDQPTFYPSPAKQQPFSQPTPITQTPMISVPA